MVTISKIKNNRPSQISFILQTKWGSKPQVTTKHKKKNLGRPKIRIQNSIQNN